jgi:transposase
MTAAPANQITSLDEARACITRLQNEFQQALAAAKSEHQQSLAALQSENKLLRQKLALFLARYFGGTKNESLDPKQLELLLAGLEAVSANTPVAVVEKSVAPTRTATARPARAPLPAHLETERVVLEPAEVQQQPAGWRKLGEEVTEELDWKPAKFIKRLFIRPKYANAERIVIAPLPARLIEKGLPGAGLLTQVIVGKYEDHLPLYRQEKIYRERHGVNLSRQTLCGWVEASADWLTPIYREMKAALLARNYLQADETPIRYLDPDVKGKSQQGWLWAYSAPEDDVVFEWHIRRSREAPREFLKSFAGKLQTDGYSVYESLVRERGKAPGHELTLIGCWAHVRRGFHEALGEGRTVAWFMGQIGKLYAVEKHLREQKAGPQLRAAVRAWQSRPILTRLRRAMEVVRRRVLPKSLLGQAIDYALNRWETLVRYVDDGRLEIDNNLCENAIRPTAVGKKNFLFIGHPEAGQRSAVIYSVLGSCRRHGINPDEYLRDVFERLPKAKTSELKALTPSAWAKAKRATTRPAA